MIGEFDRVVASQGGNVPGKFESEADIRSILHLNLGSGVCTSINDEAAAKLC